MSSITAQQTKLDLELFPKEKRLEIGKCNERLNPGKIQKEPTFQVVLDVLALTSCYIAFLITADVLEVYMHQFWGSGQDFDALPTDEEIVSSLENLDILGRLIHSMMLLLIICINLGELLLLSLTKVYLERQLVLTSFISTEHKSFRRNKIRMHSSKDDYLVNSLRFVSIKEATQIYGAILPKSLTSPKMKETNAYKTYLGFATGATPPKKARKFKKPASHQLTTISISPEEPTKKSKRVKKSLRDFHKTHLSGSGTVTKTTLSAAKIKQSVTNEGTAIKPEVLDVIKEESSKSEVESWGNDEDNINNEQDSKSEGSNKENDSDNKNTQSDSEKGLDSEHEIDENESDSESYQEVEEEIRYDEEEEKDEFVRTPFNDFDDETRCLIKLKTKVVVTSSSHSSDLAPKFLNFSDVHFTDAKIVSPMDIHVHHEVPSKQTPTLLIVPVSVITASSPIYSAIIPQSIPSFTPPPPQSTPTPPPITEAINPLSTLPDFESVFQFNNIVTTLEKEVAKLKKDDPLKTQVTALVDEHLDARLAATINEFINYLSASIIARIIEQVKNQLPHIMLEEVSNFPHPPSPLDDPKDV
uniref:Integrase, catalytic region, zinc finger, CCHC-type, peptidase aspartic, catalytic n=1 Tax=Tanacetum cinerariifolium TaxID=118510 RepID=A0A6L2JBN5_TANCI|nr:hypothetical protein [Tanacetum cinerariifolium]